MQKKILLSSMIAAVILMGVFSSGCLETGPKTGTATIKVSYSGSWSGSLGSTSSAGETSTSSVSGTGTKTFDVSGSFVSAVIQKSDDSSNTLTVQIIVNGNIVKQESTSAAYGVVSVSYSFA